MAKSTSNRRHPLLIYVRLFARWRTPALLLAIAFLVLVVWAPGPLADDVLRLALLAGAVDSLLLFIYSVLGPRLSYVQCRPTHLLVSTPLFRLAISYNRIHTARAVPFEPPNVSVAQESLVGPLRGMTMLALDLNGYPVARRWLKLLLNPFLLPDKFLGLQLLVPDWMALSRDIEVRRGQWQMRDRDRSKGDALTSLTMPRR
jgi:hypothetical protein